MVDILRVGIIGVGDSATNFHIPVLQRLEGCEIVASCDVQADCCLAELPAYTDYREMLARETLDLIYVLTPPGTHLEPVCLALAKGCHVFCEMPPSLEPLDTAQMIAFAHESGRSLLFGDNRRFAPIYRKVREITRQEPPKMTVLTKCRHELHEVFDEFTQAVEAQYARRFPLQGTPMFLGICQFLDMAEWLNGPIVHCEAFPGKLMSTMRTNTNTISYLEHENGARSMISYDEFGKQACEHVTVHSSASTYIIRGSMLQPNELLVWTGGMQQTYPASSDPLVRDGFLDQTRYLCEHIRDGKQILPDEALYSRILHLARTVDGSERWNDLQ